MQPDHVVHLSPAVLTDPVSFEAGHVVRGAVVAGRTDPVVLGVIAIYDLRLEVAAHQSHVSVLPGQLEGRRDLVHVRVAPGDEGAERFRLLIVVVVDEDERVLRVLLTPRFAEVLQVRHRLSVVLSHDVAEVVMVAELHHATDARVFVAGDRLAAVVITSM